VAVSLEVPVSSVDTQKVSLGGIVYNIKYTFNTRDNRWRLDISTNAAGLIKAGVKVMENQSLLRRYQLDNFSGDIYCVRSKEDGLDVGRDNLGIGKAYELIYFSESEINQ